jgi:hypothetical protein
MVQKLRLVNWSVPSRPALAVPQHADSIFGTELGPIRKSWTQCTVIRCGNVSQEPVVFAPNEKVWVTIQDRLQQGRAATPGTKECHGLIRGSGRRRRMPVIQNVTSESSLHFNINPAAPILLCARLDSSQRAGADSLSGRLHQLGGPS